MIETIIGIIVLFIVIVIAIIPHVSPTRCLKCNKKAVYPIGYDAGFDKTLFMCKKCGAEFIIP